MPRRSTICIVALLLLAWLLGNLGAALPQVQAASGPDAVQLQITPGVEEPEGPPTPTPLPPEYLIPQSHPALIIGIVVLVLIILLGVIRLPRRR